MKLLEFELFGQQARDLAKHYGLEQDGETADENCKIFFEYKSIEGHPKVIIKWLQAGVDE